MLRRFINDMKKYFQYSIVAARASLKAEVAGSYLNWIWWILEPVCFMLIYTFIFGYVFKSREQYFPIFVYIGLCMWQFFERTIKQSILLVKKNKSVVTKVYIPKFILILIRIWVNGFKMLISFAIVIALMLVYRVPLSWNIFYSIPIMLTMCLFTFGCATFLMHFGVYVADLSNVVNIAMKFFFYLAGIFYNVETRIETYGELLCKVNPIAFLITSLRQSLIYAMTPGRKLLILWFLISFVISIFGIRKIYKNENSYVKMI